MAGIRYVVKWPEAELVVDGEPRILRAGESVPAGLDPHLLENLELVGALVRLSASEDASPVVPDAVSTPTVAPAPSAAKDSWVAWAVACGADPVQAEEMTKKALIEQYGEATVVIAPVQVVDATAPTEPAPAGE